MVRLRENARAYLVRRFPDAALLEQKGIHISELLNGVESIAKEISLIEVIDMATGIKYRVIVIEDLGSKAEVDLLSENCDASFKSVSVLEINAPTPRKLNKIPERQYYYSPRMLIYTNKIFAPIELIESSFKKKGFAVEIIDESAMYKSLFISYGGPDEMVVSLINSKFKERGVSTWFFPVDAPAGEKLHRVMSEGISKYDKVLLICSENSLTRPGVLNEIERVLEREAREGGSSILIPIALDKYVFTWKPERTDLADQVLTRVIKNFPVDDKNQIDIQIDGIIKVLRN